MTAKTDKPTRARSSVRTEQRNSSPPVTGSNPVAPANALTMMQVLGDIPVDEFVVTALNGLRRKNVSPTARRAAAIALKYLQDIQRETREYFDRITRGALGSGADPLRFLVASHNEIRIARADPHLIRLWLAQSPRPEAKFVFPMGPEREIAEMIETALKEAT